VTVLTGTGGRHVGQSVNQVICNSRLSLSLLQESIELMVHGHIHTIKT